MSAADYPDTEKQLNLSKFGDDREEEGRVQQQHEQIKGRDFIYLFIFKINLCKSSSKIIG